MMDLKPSIKDAKISKCGKYRYWLSRIWDKRKPKVLFIMFNPSTADSLRDDPTIRKCIAFAEQWGYGGFYVCNLFNYRSSKPEGILNTPGGWGTHQENWVYIDQLLNSECQDVVLAWGDILDKGSGKLKDRKDLMVSGLKHGITKGNGQYKIFSIGHLTQKGNPRHPLWTPLSYKLIKYV